MSILGESPAALPFGTILVRLLLALAFGGLVGLDRQIHKKPAGLRTLMLVCLGACAFTVLTALYRGPLGEAMTSADASRIIQGIVGGIGFLGAGVIIHTGVRPAGITTAASIWVTAAVGVAFGLGEFRLGIAAGLLAVLTLATFGRIEYKVFNQDNEHRPPDSGGSPK